MILNSEWREKMILGPSTAKASAADHCAAAGDVGLSQRGLIQSPAGGMDMWILTIDMRIW